MTVDPEQPSGTASPRQYSGPVFPGEFEEVADVDKWCEWMVEEDPLPGARTGNSPTNIGETIEACADLPASTRAIDFDKLKDGRVEVKAGRLGKKTPTTLATRCFDSYTGKPYPGGELKSRSSRFNQFVEEFAYESEMTIQKGPMEGKTAARKNLTGIDLTSTPHPITGLFIELSENEELLWVCEGKGPKKRRLLFYDQLDADVIHYKLKSQYYVEADEVKLDDGNYAYDVKSVEGWSYKMARLTPKLLYEYVTQGILILQLRAHICDDFICKHGPRGKPCFKWKDKGPGYVRDHGTGIRISPDKVTKVYDKKKIA